MGNDVNTIHVNKSVNIYRGDTVLSFRLMFYLNGIGEDYIAIYVNRKYLDEDDILKGNTDKYVLSVYKNNQWKLYITDNIDIVNIINRFNKELFI